MIYGYENFTLTPIIFSVLTSIFLFIGSSILGFLILKIKYFDSIKYNNFFYLNSPLIFFNFVLLAFSPFLYLELLNIKFLYIFSHFILFVGILGTIFILLKYGVSFNFLIKKKLLFFILLLYFFLTLCPITHADSLAYHMNVAVNFINTGTFFNKILPIESQLAGLAEILISLGLLTGSIQFGAIVQFSGLLSIVAVFLNLKKELKNLNYYLLISVITTPVCLFFLSSPKPQIMQIANELLCFSIIFIFFKKLPKQQFLFFSVLVFLLLIVNFLSKFSFLVSSFFIYSYCAYYLIKRKNYFFLTSTSVILGLIFIYPNFIFKYYYFNTDYIDFLKGPLSYNIFGYKIITESIKGPIQFIPYWIIFPSHLANFSTIIGPIFFTFLLSNYRNLKKNILYFVIILIYIFLIIFLVQSSSRFIFNSFVLTQFFIIFLKFNSDKFFNYFKIYLSVQVISAIIILIIFISNLLPGSLSRAAYTKIMSSYSNGYNLITWANSYLNKNDKIISTHRSISLYNVEAIEYWPFDYIDFDDTRSNIYLNYIKNNKFNRILFYQDTKDTNKFRHCLGKLIASKTNVGKHVGRNFLTDGKSYSGFIYELNYNLLPGCISN